MAPELAGVVVVVDPAVPVGFGHQQRGLFRGEIVPLLDALDPLGQVRPAEDPQQARPPGQGIVGAAAHENGGFAAVGDLADHVELPLGHVVGDGVVKFVDLAAENAVHRPLVVLLGQPLHFRVIFPELVNKLPVQHPDAQPLAQQDRQVMPAAAVFAANGDKNLLFHAKTSFLHPVNGDDLSILYCLCPDLSPDFYGFCTGK